MQKAINVSLGDRHLSGVKREIRRIDGMEGLLLIPNFGRSSSCSKE
jgi:hypothetical protein